MSVRLLVGRNHDGDATDSLLRGPAHCHTRAMSAHAQSWPFSELATIPFTGDCLSNDAIAKERVGVPARGAALPLGPAGAQYVRHEGRLSTNT